MRSCRPPRRSSRGAASGPWPAPLEAAGLRRPRPTTRTCRASASGASSWPAAGPGGCLWRCRGPALPRPRTACPRCSHFPPDMARVPAEPNRFRTSCLVHIFEEEWGKVQASERRAAAAAAPARLARRGSCRRPARSALLGLPARRRGRRWHVDEMRWVGAAHERGHRLRDATARHVHRPCAGPLTSGALACWCSAAASPAWRRRAPSCAGAVSTTCTCSNWRTPPAATAAATRWRHACPLGAHYLPVPGRGGARGERAGWRRLGLRRIDARQARVHDERHLCHSPQERLFIEGQWHEGLLPPVGTRCPPRLRVPRRFAEQYRRFSGGRVAALGRGRRVPHARPRARRGRRSMPRSTRRPSPPGWRARALDAPALHWYLDYCCRDDYGAGSAQVSAWAGRALLRQPARLPRAGRGRARGRRARGRALPGPRATAGSTQRLAAPLGDAAAHRPCRARGSCARSRHQVGARPVERAADQSPCERWTGTRSVVLARAAVRRGAWRCSCRRCARRWTTAAAAMRARALAGGQPALRPPAASTAAGRTAFVGQRASTAAAALGYVDAMHQSTAGRIPARPC